jgi:hypothetical protein
MASDFDRGAGAWNLRFASQARSDALSVSRWDCVRQGAPVASTRLTTVLAKSVDDVSAVTPPLCLAERRRSTGHSVVEGRVVDGC